MVSKATGLEWDPQGSGHNQRRRPNPALENNPVTDLGGEDSAETKKEKAGRWEVSQKRAPRREGFSWTRLNQPWQWQSRWMKTANQLAIKTGDMEKRMFVRGQGGNKRLMRKETGEVETARTVNSWVFLWMGIEKSAETGGDVGSKEDFFFKWELLKHVYLLVAMVQ